MRLKIKFLGVRAFRSSVDLSAISEPEAVKRALRRQTYPDGADRQRLVISSGGETVLMI